MKQGISLTVNQCVDAVAQALDDGLGVAAEGVDGGRDEPAPPVFEGLRQVPVKERDPGGDSARQQGVDQPGVEVKPARIDRAVARRERRAARRPRGGSA